MAPTHRTRLLSLDLMRGLCASSVALYHFMSWTDVAHVESMGTFAVYIFFILSALTMMYSYAGKFDAGLTKQLLQVFYINRIARVMPLLAIVAVLMGALRVVGSDQDIFQIMAGTVLTGTGLFALHLPGLSSNVVGGWSLGIEGMFYVLFPALILLTEGMQARRMLWIVAVLVIVQQLAIHLSRGHRLEISWYLYVSPIVFAPFFGLGVAIFLKPRAPRLVNLWIGLGLLAMVIGTSLVWDGPIVGNPVAYVGLTVLSAGAVHFLYQSDLPNWLAGVGRWLGDLSYAIYLVHWFAFQASQVAAGRLGLDVGAQALLFIVIVAGLAYLTYFGVEKPLQRYIRRKANVIPSSK